MCGISGLWNREIAVTDGATIVTRMRDRLHHRGPDDAGIWSSPDERLHLGHRRLSILDLSPAGHQPMISSAGNVIVFNGEIFNFQELKNRFLPDVQLRSTGDTEILLHLYEKLGHDCVNHLNGMFAFAIWDATKEELFIARDRLGKKPFYYTTINGCFAFASEIKALCELPGWKSELDPTALYHFLTFNLLAPPQTMFRGVMKLPPAHYMVLRKTGSPVVERYWTTNYSDISHWTEKQLKEQTLDLLESAVRYRTVSDVPVGAFLSGGVDSSAVVALMAQQSTTPVRTYSIGFEGQSDYDERKFAEKISKRFGTDHHERIVRPHDITDLLPHIVDYFDEPMADATCIPIHFLSEKAHADGTTVVLTGDGGDELFAGYHNWKKYAELYPFYQGYRKLPGIVRRTVASFQNNFGKSDLRQEMLERAAKGQEFFWGGAKSFKEHSKRSILSDTFIDTIGSLDSYEVIAAYRQQFETDFSLQRKSPIDWMCYLGVHFTIPNYYLYRMDRLGMANSIEIRSPFLDYRLVEFALSIDPSWKIKNGEPKYILKKSLEGLLSDEILYRKKRGFNVPMREWAGDILTDYIDEHLAAFCKDFPYFRYEGIKAEVIHLRKGKAKATNRLWTIYFLMQWFNRWMK